MARTTKNWIIAVAALLALPGVGIAQNAPFYNNVAGSPSPAQGTILVCQGGGFADLGNCTYQTTATATPSGSASAGIAPVASAVAEACHVLKAGAGNLYSVSGYIGAAGFIMVFDSATAPADGAVTPTVWAYVPAAGSWSISYGSIPASFLTGITVCASSTGPLTKTAYSTNTVFSGNVK